MAGSRLQVAIVGAGNVGLALARMLVSTGEYQVRVGDCTDEACAQAITLGIEARQVDASSATQLHAFLGSADVAVAAVPDRLVSRIMNVASQAGAHHLDFSMPSETPANADGALKLSGCGVSPGLADLMIARLSAQADGPIDVELAVGAIPARRTNRLGYSLIWNLDGLYAEYTSPCEAIENFELVEIPPLSRPLTIRLGQTDYEAFSTAGVVGSIGNFAGDNIRNLTCRTIRYPGHLDYMQLLLDDFGLRHRRDLLRTILQNGLDKAEGDIVLLHARSRRVDGEADPRTITIRIEDAPGLGNALAAGSAAHAAYLIDNISAGSLRLSQDDPDTFAGLVQSRFARGIMSIEEL